MMPPSLEILNLGDSPNARSMNQFTGGIPAEWGSLTNLKELKMVACGLDGVCSYVQFDTKSPAPSENTIFSLWELSSCSCPITDSLGTFLLFLPYHGNFPVEINHPPPVNPPLKNQTSESVPYP